MGGTAIDFSPQRREVYFLLSNLFEFYQKVKFHISKNLIFQKNYDRTSRYHETYSESGVRCEPIISDIESHP